VDRLLRRVFEDTEASEFVGKLLKEYAGSALTESGASQAEGLEGTYISGKCKGRPQGTKRPKRTKRLLPLG
jgi:hypothetical protein